MSVLSMTACTQFVQAFDHLTATVRERLELEWRYHQRGDLQKLAEELLDHAVEFGRLLRVVFKHDLVDALTDEASWYAAVLRSRGPKQDAFSLLLDSWIVAIQGVIKPPECNELTKPLQILRANMPQVLELSQARFGTPPSADIRGLVEWLIAGDFAQAQAVVQSLLTAGMNRASVITAALLPAMKDVGRRWENNDLTIFQEHLATETLRRLLVVLTVEAGEIKLLHKTAIASCVPGDQHQLLPLALGIFLELRGWQVRSLGGGLPSGEIATAVAAFSASALFLSLPMLSRLDEALDTCVCVRTRSPRCRIIIGGRGAAIARGLLEQAGAHVALDFDEAHHAALEEASHA